MYRSVFFWQSSKCRSVALDLRRRWRNNSRCVSNKTFDAWDVHCYNATGFQRSQTDSDWPTD